MLEFLSMYLAGIGTAALLGHIARRKASRERRELAGLAEAATMAAMDVQDAVALGCSVDACEQLRTDRNRAAAAYYAALKGE